MKKLMACTLLLISSTLVTAQQGTFFWTDTASPFINHRIVSLLASDKHIYALSKSDDADYTEVRPSFSRIDLQGKVLNFTVYPSVQNFNNVNSLVKLPDGNLRIYGSIYDNDRFSPYINSVTPQGVMDANTYTMVSVPHFTGDAVQAGPSGVIWTKAIRGSATNRYNAYVYRIDLANRDQEKWKCILKSELNEEASKLVLLPDSSVLLLCKRYLDESFLSYTSVIYKISAAGELIWNKELSDFNDYTTHSILSNGNFIYYVNNMGKEETSTNSSNVVQLSAEGELVKRESFDNINVIGGLILTNGRILLYGGVYTFSGNVLTKKGKIKVLDSNLKLLKERQMGALDKPDGYLPGMAAANQPTGSDFLCAIQLPDKRVVLGGRVYMPLRYRNSGEMLLSPRANSNFLVFCNEQGDW